MYNSRHKYGDMIIILSWVDDKIIMGPDNVVNEKSMKIRNLINIDAVR